MKKDVSIICEEYLTLTNKVEELAAALVIARAKRNAIRMLLVRQNVDVSKLTPRSNQGQGGPPIIEEEYVDEYAGPDDDPNFVEA